MFVSHAYIIISENSKVMWFLFEIRGSKLIKAYFESSDLQTFSLMHQIILIKNYKIMLSSNLQNLKAGSSNFQS